MALPLAPIAFTLARYGAVAVFAYGVARQLQRSEIHQENEDALDRVPEGLTASRPLDRQQVNASARFRRIIRFGRSGPGLEVDGAALGRLRFRKF